MMKLKSQREMDAGLACCDDDFCLKDVGPMRNYDRHFLL
jgi:hypothetical protein